MIGIVDYGAGNLYSIVRALEYISAPCKIVKSATDGNRISKMILPGVGAFQSAINNLMSNDLFRFIEHWLASGKSFLGICLGMQVLCQDSEEASNRNGFGIFTKTVKRFEMKKVPQIGWNKVEKVHPSKLLYSIPANSYFYFLHGYYVPLLNDISVGVTEYGVLYSSVIENDNIYAVQFHPEKSGRVGLKVLQNWVELC
jgi:glutamine amidotransferase